MAVKVVNHEANDLVFKCPFTGKDILTDDCFKSTEPMVFCYHPEGGFQFADDHCQAIIEKNNLDNMWDDDFEDKESETRGGLGFLVSKLRAENDRDYELHVLNVTGQGCGPVHDTSYFCFKVAD